MELKYFYRIQTGLLILGVIALFFSIDWRAAASYGAGTGLTLVNVALMAWLWSRLFQKKQIALALFIIVFKYAILGLILYELLKTEWISPLWFCAGIGTLMFAALGTALMSPAQVEQ